ncbi:hypothetical protein [Nonomuraea soli]|uniref:Uncharacterized protein n=1 Tax=Nonomuraea soli TaxID=1032476 RepID=A0A7W0CDD0_9ACTN|nr:hypothetical protein [Nonomuraea soli]MBA2888935.1 hypothetical protein [Nonomuraea soli]
MRPVLSTVVMTHPARLDRARRLAAQLSRLEPRIVVDPAPDEGPSTLRTAAAAWSAVAPGVTHHLVVQDDAIPCAHFPERVLAAVARHPGLPLSLFAEWGSHTAHSLRMVAAAGGTWTEVADQYVPSVALVMPAALARAFGRAATEEPGTFAGQDDVALRQFMTAAGTRALCRIPNLVEHAEEESLTGNDGYGPRHSVCFLDDVRDGPAPESVGLAERLPVVTHRLEATLPPLTVCVGRRDSLRHPWRVLAEQEAFREFGLEAAAVRPLARERLARHGGLASDPGLEAAWFMSFLVGAALADPRPAVRLLPPGRAAELGEVIASPVVRRAFTTLPQGVLTSPRARELEKELGESMLEAIVLGHARGGRP